MNRNERIETLIKENIEQPFFPIGNIIFYFLLFALISLNLYFFVLIGTPSSIRSLILGLASIFLLIFFRKNTTIGFSIQMIYYTLAVILYGVWIAILIPPSYSEMNQWGFPAGWECLAEILFIGFSLGLLLHISMRSYRISLPKNIHWITLVFAIGFGYLVVDFVCRVEYASHDLIWHGMFPFLLAIWIFFRKL